MKRALDLLFSLMGLFVLSPFLLFIMAVIKLSDGGPVFFRQVRVGQRGREFRIWKFRTMVVNAEKLGLSITRDGDPRITRIGRFLRKSKLDELPQLLNVLVGEMSLVGPRPEVPRYVEQYSAEQRRILELKPGITDLATLEFSHEEDLLKSRPDVERFYLEYCVPRKIELNRRYAADANILSDLRILLKTLLFWRNRTKGLDNVPVEFPTRVHGS